MKTLNLQIFKSFVAVNNGIPNVSGMTSTNYRFYKSNFSHICIYLNANRNTRHNQKLHYAPYNSSFPCRLIRIQIRSCILFLLLLLLLILLTVTFRE